MPIRITINITGRRKEGRERKKNKKSGVHAREGRREVDGGGYSFVGLNSTAPPHWPKVTPHLPSSSGFFFCPNPLALDFLPSFSWLFSHWRTSCVPLLTTGRGGMMRGLWLTSRMFSAERPANSHGNSCERNKYLKGGRWGGRGGMEKC